jgi:hypothetical protein
MEIACISGEKYFEMTEGTPHKMLAWISFNFFSWAVSCFFQRLCCDVILHLCLKLNSNSLEEKLLCELVHLTELISTLSLLFLNEALHSNNIKSSL